MSTNSIFSDDALRAARYALDGLSARQQVISQNVANVDTPGYNAQQVDFESTMQMALDGQSRGLKVAKTNSQHMEHGDNASALYQIANRTGGTYREDGNNVDIDTELLEMSSTQLQYQAVTQAVSKKLLLLKTIAQGG